MPSISPRNVTPGPPSTAAPPSQRSRRPETPSAGSHCRPHSVSWPRSCAPCARPDPVLCPRLRPWRPAQSTCSASVWGVNALILAQDRFCSFLSLLDFLLPRAIRGDCVHRVRCDHVMAQRSATETERPAHTEPRVGLKQWAMRPKAVRAGCAGAASAQ